jgi:hypothetical protein
MIAFRFNGELVHQQIQRDMVQNFIRAGTQTVTLLVKDVRSPFSLSPSHCFQMGSEETLNQLRETLKRNINVFDPPKELDLSQVVFDLYIALSSHTLRRLRSNSKRGAESGRNLCRAPIL